MTHASLAHMLESVAMEPKAMPDTRVLGPGKFPLRSGAVYDLLNPNPDVVTLRDVIHHTSHICRFNGACLDFYSVCQHSAHCCDEADPEHKWEALMHDAVESVIGDMIKPFKEELPDYKRIEALNETAWSERFHLPNPMTRAVKVIDTRMFVTEWRDLMDRHPMVCLGDEFKPYDWRITPREPLQARGMFMQRYMALETASLAPKGLL